MKELIRRIVQAAGYEIQHSAAGTSDPFRRQENLMTGVPAPVVFDVGANAGMIAEKYRHIFPGAKIYAFEPFPEAFAALDQRFRADTNIQTRKLALGAVTVKKALRINSASVTNSLLDTEETAAAFWGEGLLETTSTVAVDVETIDEFCRKNQIECIDILKIDTQGTELDVLRGAAEMLSNRQVRVIYTEMIVVPTYKGQYKVHELMAFLDGFGYSLSGLYNLWNRSDGRLLQMDAIFVKPGMSPPSDVL